MPIFGKQNFGKQRPNSQSSKVKELGDPFRSFRGNIHNLQERIQKLERKILREAYHIAKKKGKPVYELYEKALVEEVKSKPLPDHIGLILDGNRRWAREKLLPIWIGHQQGADKMKQVFDWCFDLGIKTLTIYTFSTENFKRERKEVEEIMKIIKGKLEELKTSEEIYKSKIRVRVIGKTGLLPKELRSLISEIEELTKNHNGHYLNFAIGYGGRREIVDATKEIAKRVVEGKLKLNEIDEKVLEQHLYTSHLPNPHPSLIIRTGGEERLSNFLTWQSAYSELMFLDIYWPDFRAIDLYRAIITFQNRKRRFGK